MIRSGQMIDILPRRIKRMKDVISKRQYDLSVILENVHDPHNIGAVIRTCDSVGIREIFVIQTDPRLSEKGLEIGLQSSSGAKPWIRVNYFTSVHECFTEVNDRYEKVYGTSIGANSVGLYDLNLVDSCALLFGNEHQGLSDEALKHVDKNFLIPQSGFVQSLNISVACAVSLYEASRQRHLNGKYDLQFGEHQLHPKTLDEYMEIHQQKKFNKINNKKVI